MNKLRRWCNSSIKLFQGFGVGAVPARRIMNVLQKMMEMCPECDLPVSFYKITIQDCTLYLGNCLEVIPLIIERYDAVVTDPPFGVKGGTGGYSREHKKAQYISNKFEDTPEYIEQVCVKSIAMLNEKNIPMAVTTGNRNMMKYPQPCDIGCFWTPAGTGMGTWGFSTFHPILYYGRDWRGGKCPLPSGRTVTERAEKNGHPCPKPIDAWTWLVDKVAPPNCTVLDPFMGSATTAEACIRTGRKFVGIEIEEEYFRLSCERIRNVYGSNLSSASKSNKGSKRIVF